MTQAKDLIKKMADFFASEEYYEKGEDARLELSSDDVRCMNEIIKACGNAISREDAIKQCGFGMTSLLIADCLRRLPSVNPQEPKTGYWIVNKDNSDSSWMICDKCRKTFEKHLKKHLNWKYCPVCGDEKE